MPTPEETGKEPSSYDDEDQAYEEARGVKQEDADDYEVDETDIVDIDLDDLVAMEGPDA